MSSLEGKVAVVTGGNKGFEIMHMMRKGQIQGVDKGDGKGLTALVARLFGGVA